MLKLSLPNIFPISTIIRIGVNQLRGAWPYDWYFGMNEHIIESLRKFNSNSNGADIAYICIHTVCLNTQKCAHNVLSEITLISEE